MAEQKVRYKPGTYHQVPNLNILEGQHPILQCVFMWLCKYAGPEGICYPSLKELAGKCGTTKKTIIKYIGDMESLGIISRTHRYKDNEQINNVYQIWIIDVEVLEEGGSVGATPPSVGATHGTITSSKDKKKSIKEKDLEKFVPYTTCPTIEGKGEARNAAFKKYFEMRKAKKRPITPNILEYIHEELKGYSEDIQTKTFEQSVKKEYQGLFPDSIKGAKKVGGPPGKRLPTLEEMHEQQMKQS